MSLFSWFCESQRRIILIPKDSTADEVTFCTLIRDTSLISFDLYLVLKSDSYVSLYQEILGDIFYSNMSSVAHGISSSQGIQDNLVKSIKMIQVLDYAMKMSVQYDNIFGYLAACNICIYVSVLFRCEPNPSIEQEFLNP